VGGAQVCNNVYDGHIFTGFIKCNFEWMNYELDEAMGSQIWWVWVALHVWWSPYSPGLYRVSYHHVWRIWREKVVTSLTGINLLIVVNDVAWVAWELQGNLLLEPACTFVGERNWGLIHCCLESLHIPRFSGLVTSASSHL